jgi:hypothetical protein
MATTTERSPRRSRTIHGSSASRPRELADPKSQPGPAEGSGVSCRDGTVTMVPCPWAPGVVGLPGCPHHELLAAPVALPLDHQLEGRALEAVDGGLGQERVGDHGLHLGGVAVGGDHRGGPAVALDHQLAEVGRIAGIQAPEGEVGDQEQVDAHELAHLGVVAGIKAGGLEPPVQAVGPFEMHREAPSAGDVGQGRGQECLADTDRAEDQGIGSVLDEAQGGELG